MSLRTRSTPLLRRTGLALLVAALAGSSLALTAGAATAAPGAVSVSNGDIAPCTATSTTLCSSSVGAGTSAVVDDARASSGDGYLRLSTPGGTDKATVAHPMAGTTLGQLTTLAYQTYIEQVGTNEPRQAPSFNIALTTRPFGPTNSTFTTLVWEPVYRTGATVTPGVWQPWSPSSGDGWWATRTTQVTGQVNELGFKTYTATFAEVVAAVGPTAVVQSIAVNQGSGSPGLRSGVDLLQINDRVIDFENPVSATAITATAGNAQSAAVGTTFPTRLSATVTGGIKKPRPVPNTPVVFTVTSGSAAFAGSPSVSVLTGADGVATAPALTAGTAAGPVTITATSASGASTEALVSTTFTATVTAPPPAAVTDLQVTVSAPPTARPGASFVATVTVTNKGTAPVARASTAVTLDGGLLVTSAPGSVGPAAGKSVAFVDGPLAAGASATHRITVVGARVGAAEVRATTGSGGVDATPADNTAKAAVRIG